MIDDPESCEARRDDPLIATLDRAVFPAVALLIAAVIVVLAAASAAHAIHP